MSQVSVERKKKEAAPVPSAANLNGKESPPAELAGELAKVAALLSENKAKEALEFIGRAKNGSPWMRNAVGVCQLRLGNANLALETLKGLALSSGGFDLKETAPTVFKTNYGAALLLTGNRDGFFRVLEDLHDVKHPTVDRLRQVVEDWKKGLSFWQKLGWWLGGQGSAPSLPFPPGDLA